MVSEERKIIVLRWLAEEIPSATSVQCLIKCLGGSCVCARSSNQGPKTPERGKRPRAVMNEAERTWTLFVVIGICVCVLPVSCATVAVTTDAVTRVRVP